MIIKIPAFFDVKVTGP